MFVGLVGGIGGLWGAAGGGEFHLGFFEHVDDLVVFESAVGDGLDDEEDGVVVVSGVCADDLDDVAGGEFHVGADGEEGEVVEESAEDGVVVAFLAAVEEGFDGVVGVEGGSPGAWGDEGVVGVGDGDDAGECVDVGFFAAARIAFSVDAFVVLVDHEAGDGGESGHVLQGVEACDGVLLDVDVF